MKIDDGLCEYSLPLKMSGDPPFPLRMGWEPISTENGTGGPFPLRMGVTRVTSSVPAHNFWIS